MQTEPKSRMQAATVVLGFLACLSAGVQADAASGAGAPSSAASSGSLKWNKATTDSVIGSMLGGDATSNILTPMGNEAAAIGTDAAAEAVSDSIRNLFGLPNQRMPLLAPIPVVSIPVAPSQITLKSSAAAKPAIKAPTNTYKAPVKAPVVKPATKQAAEQLLIPKVQASVVNLATKRVPVAPKPKVEVLKMGKAYRKLDMPQGIDVVEPQSSEFQAAKEARETANKAAEKAAKAAKNEPQSSQFQAAKEARETANKAAEKAAKAAKKAARKAARKAAKAAKALTSKVTGGLPDLSPFGPRPGTLEITEPKVAAPKVGKPVAATKIVKPTVAKMAAKVAKMATKIAKVAPKVAIKSAAAKAEVKKTANAVVAKAKAAIAKVAPKAAIKSTAAKAEVKKTAKAVVAKAKAAIAKVAQAAKAAVAKPAVAKPVVAKPVAAPTVAKVEAPVLATRAVPGPPPNVDARGVVSLHAVAHEAPVSKDTVVKPAAPPPAPHDDMPAVITLTMVPPAVNLVVEQQQEEPAVRMMTMVPTAVTPFEPMSMEESKPQAGLFSRMFSAISGLFWSAPPPKVHKPVLRLAQVVTVTEKQDVKANEVAAAEDSFANIDIHDSWVAQEQEDDKVVEHVKREDRALRVDAETVKEKPMLPVGGVADRAGSTHISGFWQNLAVEDQAMIKVLNQGGEDVTEYARLVDAQDAKVAAAVGDLNGNAGKRLRVEERNEARLRGEHKVKA